MIGYLNKSYLQGGQTRRKIGKEVVITRGSWESGMIDILWVAGILLLSHFIMISTVWRLQVLGCEGR